MSTPILPPNPAQVVLDDAELIAALGLDWTPEMTEAYLEGITKYYVKRLTNDGPPVPRGVFCAKDIETKTEWDAAWEEAQFADNRVGKEGKTKTTDAARRIEVVDRAAFPHNIRRSESGLFYDQDTIELVFLRLPNMVKSDEILVDMNEVCKAAVRERRNVRRDDPGTYVEIGMTAGSRSDRKTQLSDSLLTKASMKPEAKARINMEEAGMSALAWNIMKTRIPPEVVRDYNGTIAAEGLARMDGGLKDAVFSIWTKDHGKEYRLSGLEAAPSRGGCAMNYCRFCHNETASNKYGIALTTVCTALPQRGGNFFIAQYGIFSQAEANTVTCFRVNDFHGTTLYRLTPRQNCGVAFFVPKASLPGDVSLPFTHGELTKVQRPKYSAKGKADSVASRNQFYLREPTPESETEDTAGNASKDGEREEEVAGEDGSTAAEQDLLETAGDAKADEYDQLVASGVQEE